MKEALHMTPEEERFNQDVTGAVGERGPAYDTRGGALQPRWRTGSPWLLDRCDEAGREEQSSHQPLTS